MIVQNYISVLAVETTWHIYTTVSLMTEGILPILDNKQYVCFFILYINIGYWDTFAEINSNRYKYFGTDE